MNYLLEFTICTAIFYGLYWLIFRRLTFIRLNRIYLLASLILSLCIPLISYQMEETVFINESISETSENDISTPLILPKSMPSFATNTLIEKPFDWEMILWITYGLGIVVLSIKLFIFFIKILKMSRLKKGKPYISTKGKLANSSFLNLIFIDDTELSHQEIEQIITHEKWHIRLYHSYDLLFIEIVKIAFWFNPVLWFLQRSLSQVHEYEVDSRMIQAYNPQTYANLLLKLASTTPRLSLAHQFSRKPLTDRIHFLFTKQKSTPMKRLAYLSILPLLGVLLTAFSVEKVVKYQVVEKPDEKYFKVIKKPDNQVNNEVTLKNDKPVSNLIYGKNKVAFSLNPNDIAEGKALDEATKYFKNIGFSLEMTRFEFYNNKKGLEKIELTLTEEKSNKVKYRSKKPDKKSELPAKFMFDLAKMKGSIKGKGLDDIITIFADRSTGEHFVAPLAPPPPPPVPPMPPKMPPPPPAPVKGKTKLSVVRKINASGLIVDSETFMPIIAAEVFDDDNKLLGNTDSKGFFKVSFDVENEGEIYFKLSIKKDGYNKFTQNEHWGDLQGNSGASYCFGLKKKHSNEEEFSELLPQNKSYEDLKEELVTIKEERDFEKKIENAKKNNNNVFFKIDNDFYLINNSGWIKVNSENDKILVNGNKIYVASEINLYVKRSGVTGMSPIKSKEASFEIYAKAIQSSSTSLKEKTKLSVNNFKEKGLDDSFFQPAKMKIPADMIAIKKGIYVENGVVKNVDYQAFLDYISQDKYFSKKYAKNMIPENWGNVNKMQNAVINMSFEQGDEYCKWRTEMFTYQMMNQKKADHATILKENDKLSKKYKFRLPTANEWALIVKKGFIIRTGFTCVLDLT
jgi:beta-lactamase regulating signal transducer with metallopeptidase domain